VCDFVHSTSEHTMAVSHRICQEISDIGNLIRTVSQRAVQVVSDTQGQLSSMALARTRAGLSESIHQTILLVNQQLDWVVSKVNKQERLAQEAVERCQKLQLVARALRRLSFQSHLLAINAKVSAAHIGERGDAIAVIADEINRLNQNVNRVCDDIGRFSSALSTGLQALCANSAQISNVTREFALLLHSTIEKARGQNEALDEELRALLGCGGPYIERLQQAAARAELHLRFETDFQRQLQELNVVLASTQELATATVYRVEQNLRRPLPQ